ncbi:MAG: hypothetical protein DI588_09150 [Flavobacterium johnsoniae]|nr:MAG: hypothetical protein DI588_09150 [Flavobacterium johnsoniae]
MEKSEAQQAAINLGKLLVKELQLETSVDTLGRWMAHYLAIKMTEAENANGGEKSRLEKECFNIILKIWNHRWQLPGNSKPFQNFVPIFEFLVKLNPDSDRLFYYDDARASKKRTVTKKISKSDEWLDIANAVDKYARICIKHVLNNATSELTTQEDKKWLENAPRVLPDIDVQIINMLLDKEKNLDLIGSTEENKEDLIKKIEIEKLQSNIEFLQNFQKFHGKLLRDLKQKLAEVNQ